MAARDLGLMLEREGDADGAKAAASVRTAIARWAALRTLGTGSPLSLITAPSPSSIRCLAITLAAISRTRQASSETAKTTVAVALSFQA